MPATRSVRTNRNRSLEHGAVSIHAPPISSHELRLQRAKLPRAAIAEGLVRPFGVIPFDPLSNGGAGFGEAGEVMLPDTLFFEAAKEAFDEAVLFGRVGRDELLRQTVIAAGG